jgi:hypothetical protein
MNEDEDEDGDGTIAHPPEGEQESSLESEETLSPDERGDE